MANSHSLIASTTATISLILLFLSPLTTAGTPVLDVQGNPLEPGSKYYVATAGRGAAGRGGLTAASKEPNLCPLYVGQYGWWSDRGTPVTITPSNTTHKDITEGMDVNFSFGPNPCRTTGVWKINVSEDGVFLVTNDGTPGDPSSSLDAFFSTFQIRSNSGGWSYKIVYCFATAVPPIFPPVRPPPEFCQQLDATVLGSNGLTWLSLVPMENPLPFFGFVFVKADEDGSSNYQK